MNPHQEVRIRDIKARRVVVDAWLPGAVEEVIAAAPRRLRRRPPVEPETYRAWSDGTVSVDRVLPAHGPLAEEVRRTDLLGPVSGDHDLSVDAWQVMSQWTAEALAERPGLLPLREPDKQGTRSLSGFTYWEGDWETCVLLRGAIAEWVAAIHAIERDELMMRLEALEVGMKANVEALEAQSKATVGRRRGGRHGKVA